MRLPWSLALLALTIAEPAAAAARFETVAGSAQRVEALEPFLNRYVGRCTDIYERRTCEANVQAARRAAAGKTFTVRVPDAASWTRTVNVFPAMARRTAWTFASQVRRSYTSVHRPT